MKDHNELTEGGAQRALYIALLGAIRVHASPHLAAKSALSAVEREYVKLLNTPTQFGEYFDAYQDMHTQLTQFLHAEFDERN